MKVVNILIVRFYILWPDQNHHESYYHDRMLPFNVSIRDTILESWTVTYNDTFNS